MPEREINKMRISVDHEVLLKSSEELHEQNGSGQIAQLYTKVLLLRSELFEVCLASAEGKPRVKNLTSLTQREQENRREFDLLE